MEQKGNSVREEAAQAGAERPDGSSSPNTAGGGRAADRFGLPIHSAAEAFGGFVLVFGGVSISMFGGQSGIPGALAFGLLFTTAIIAVGHVSGGHFNPALTFGFAVAGRLAWKDVLPYIVAQVVGGAVAMALLWVVLSSGPQQIVEQLGALFSSLPNGYGQNSPGQFPLASVLLVEIVLTAVLAGVYLGATSGGVYKVLAPFAAGLTYAVLIQVALPISGGGLNPARSTATALFGGAAGQLWLFWIAPLAGAAVAGLLHRSFRPVPPAHPDVLGTNEENPASMKDPLGPPAASSAAAAPGPADPHDAAAESSDRER